MSRGDGVTALLVLLGQRLGLFYSVAVIPFLLCQMPLFL